MKPKLEAFGFSVEFCISTLDFPQWKPRVENKTTLFCGILISHDKDILSDLVIPKLLFQKTDVFLESKKLMVITAVGTNKVSRPLFLCVLIP